MTKRLKDKNAPKRPLTGFLLYGNYLRSNREEIKTLPVTQQATAIAQMWRDMDPVEKDKYVQESERLKEQYKKDIEEYEKSESYREFQTTLAESKEAKSKKESKKKTRGTIKMSGYRLFMKENKENLDEGLSEDELALKSVAKFGKKWKMLSEDERQAYNDRAALMNPTAADSGDDE